MKTISIACAAFALIGCASAPAVAQQQAQPPCSSPEHRQMDFWVGEWDVRWEASQGIPGGSGSNTITREYGDCVIQEAFDGGPSTGGLIGHSVSVYHAPAGMWRQTWVDNQGGYIVLSGGPAENGAFVLTTSRISESAPRQRMVFEDITPASLTWRWQRSADGETWADQWVIYYTRRER